MAEDQSDDERQAAEAQADALPIVGIGASAGGVKALQALFAAMPRDLGAAFVVVVHLDPDTRSELPAILAAQSSYSVEQVTGIAPLRPNHVYVIPPDRQLRISDHEIAAVRFDEPRGQRAPIDLFFRSLAEKGDGCAVVLTGAGSDGAVGVKAVKEAGGIVLVQHPEEAEYPSMPRAAIATDVADFVLPLKELAERIAELVESKLQAPPAVGSDQDEEHLRRILAHVRARTGHDFSHYKRTTVYRRVLRRMQVTRVDSMQRYYEHLRENADESQALLADLLISVTTFFRDAQAFDSLAQKIIPEIFESLDSGIVRVWVAGCATGEEAYSIAILLQEEAARHEIRPEIQVFASDLDSAALAVAREGRYPAAIRADVSEERLKRFFTEDGEYYRVKRELRDIILFANHSLLKDPPFSKLNLISCRNLLIYLDRDMQQQVLTTLHYGLNPDGFLFLGTSESADHPDGFFRPVDREYRIFQSSGRTRDQIPPLPPRLLPTSAIERVVTTMDQRNLSARGAQTVHRESLEAAAPPSVLVDKENRVINLSDSAGRFLQPPGGQLSTDITDLVRQELRLDLRTALHRAFEHGETSLSAAQFVQFNGEPHRVYLQVRPVVTRDHERRSPQRALVFFIEGESEARVAGDTATGEQPVNDNVRRLQQELELMQSRLRTTREDSEAANEELRAANEELQSINEEYRSTAEELETSKEELQSINEELQTVNSELKLKLETVSRAHSDLLNLMAASDFGTLFLDPELRIKRFTPRLAELFNITPGDVGRPITDFTNQLDYDRLAADARQVLRDLAPIEREIRSRDGGWYLLRYRPYRTVDNKIDGVVASFVDVTERRRMEDQLRGSEERLKQEMRLVELSRAPIFVWDFDDGILQWNRGSEELYGYTAQEAMGKVKNELLRTEVPGSSFEAIRRDLLAKGSWQGEVHHHAKDGRRLMVDSHIELVSVDGRRYVLESTRDITSSKTLEARLQLLVAELTHRVKNLLTVVQGMVHQTWRTSTTPDDFITRLDGRLSALSNSQKLLVDSEWRGADLKGLIEHQLAPYRDDKSSRVRLAGPQITLPAELATPFGLVLHELATNAAKYGALSGNNGRVDLNWELRNGNDGRSLRVLWKEHDGPPVRQAAETGFGSRLISRGLPGAKVEHEFHSDGVSCTIELPLPLGE